MTRRLAIAVLAVVAAGASGPVALAQTGTRLTLAPSRAETIVQPGLLAGPFTVRNGSAVPFSVELTPVLLDQRRDGGLTIGDSGSSRRAARNALRVNGGTFPLPPRRALDFRARVRFVPPRGSLYAGLLFRAVPGSEAEGISNALELVASLYLHPPRDRRRIRFDTEPIRAEQAGPRTLRFLVPVRNSGNFYTKVSGRFRLRDQTGQKVFGGLLKDIKILPGAVVDLPIETSPRELLPAGRYAAAATLEAGGRRFKATGTIRLFGPSQVATRRAELVEVSPEAFLGEPFELEVPYRNTGNVRFTPGADVRIVPQPRGEQIAARPDVTAADPGEQGLVAGTVELPDEVRTFVVRVRLKAGSRVIDEATFSVTRTEKPGLFDRLTDWLREHVVLVVLILLALPAIGAVVAVRYARRARAGDRRAAGALAVAAPEPRPPDLVDLNAATASELETLPGVGPQAAARIIEYRETHGRFSSPEDLVRVKGFGAARLAAVRDRVRV